MITVREHGLVIKHDWYNADDFRETGHVEWEELFPPGGNQRKTFIYPAGDLSNYMLATWGLETAHMLFGNNVTLGPWTSARCYPVGGGFECLVFFFTRQEDLLLFKLFSAFDK